MAENEKKPPLPIVLTGVMRGHRTIELDDESFLPDGYRVKLQLVLEPGEGLRLAAGAWADMTPEQLKELEETLSFSRGRPIHLADSEDS